MRPFWFAQARTMREKTSWWNLTSQRGWTASGCPPTNVRKRLVHKTHQQESTDINLSNRITHYKVDATRTPHTYVWCTSAGVARLSPKQTNTNEHTGLTSCLTHKRLRKAATLPNTELNANKCEQRTPMLRAVPACPESTPATRDP